MTARCSAAITSTDPVAVTKTSPSGAAWAIGSTRKPRSDASSARTGSISVTITWAPKPRAHSATPRPLAPNPATTTVLPASRVLVARRMPSIADCPVPQVLSTIRLVAVSLAAITGKASAPSAAIRRSLITPVVVDSQPPRTPGKQRGGPRVQRVDQVAAVVDDQARNFAGPRPGPARCDGSSRAGPPRPGRRPPSRTDERAPPRCRPGWTAGWTPRARRPRRPPAATGPAWRSRP